MLISQKSSLFIFLVIFSSAAVIAGENPLVNIIQIQGCDRAKCGSLSNFYPERLKGIEPKMVKPDNSDFSRKGVEQAINSRFNNSAVNIIHASGYEAIGVLNYLCNKKYAPTKPMIVILESPRVMSGEYELSYVFYKGFLSTIQQPILNDFSGLSDNIHIVIGSNCNQIGQVPYVSATKKIEHTHALALYKLFQSCGKNVYHLATNEFYLDAMSFCGCDGKLFNSQTPSAQETDIMNIIDSVSNDKKVFLYSSAWMREDDFDALKNKAHSVKNKIYWVVIGNCLFKITLVSLLAYILYTKAIAHDSFA